MLTGSVAGQASGQIAANALGPTVAKTVGDIGTDLQNQALTDAGTYAVLAQQARDSGNAAAADEYTAKANEAAATAANWGDNGVYRVGLHAATQGMLGGLANGQAGALQSSAGVVGGNLGQQLGEQLGDAEAKKLGLTGDARKAFVNAYQQTGAVVGGVVAGAAAASASSDISYDALMAAAQGGQAADTVDENNRQAHWKNFVKDKVSCDKNPDGAGCDTILKMAGVRSRLVGFMATDTANVVVNTDANGKVVSYTLLDKTTNQPTLIMEPLEFEAFRNAPAGHQALMKLSPQYALDFASSGLYASVGNNSKAYESLRAGFTSDDYLRDVALGVAGVAVSSASVARPAATAVDYGTGLSRVAPEVEGVLQGTPKLPPTTEGSAIPGAVTTTEAGNATTTASKGQYAQQDGKGYGGTTYSDVKGNPIAKESSAATTEPNNTAQGESKSLSDTILGRPTSNEWGTLENGTNQGVKHFADYWEKYPERIPSIETRLGLEPGTFDKTPEGFDAFTNAARSVIEKGQVRNLENGKSIYFLEGAENAKKGVVVITKNGKIQTMMPSDPKQFNKME